MFLLLHSKYSIIRMSLKKGLLFISSLLFIISLLTSCLGSNVYDNIVTEDAEILYFNLSSDSVPTLVNVVFSIDQGNNVIYNNDSMPYLTEIKDKVIVNYTSAAQANNVLNITDGDSIWVSSGDSLDVSKPLSFKVFAVNGTTTKTYTIKLNIHQVDPDSVQYMQVASDQAFLQAEDLKTILFKDNYFTFTQTKDEIKLYSSSDAINWNEISLSGLPANTVIRGIVSNGDTLFAYTPDGDYYECTGSTASNWSKVNLDYPVVTILGYLKPGQGQPQLSEGLSVIVKKDNQNVFAFLSNNQWTYGDIVPDNFPVSDFASFQSERMKLGYVTIIGGLSSAGEVMNDVWSTGNGLYWARLTNTTFIFPPLQGANVIEYNNEFWIVNGKDKDSWYNPGIYSSKDGGTTWVFRGTQSLYPDYYPKRFGASAVVDRNGVYFYILGGQSGNGGILTDMWKGLINSQTFIN